MTEPTRLNALLSDSADDRVAVAIRNNAVVTREAFARRVVEWQKAAGHHSAEVVGVFLEDTYEFSAALFGLWYAGKTALLAGDRLPATMAQLQGRVGALLGDFGDAGGLPVIERPIPGTAEAAPQFSSLDQAHPAVIVLTSGSTGAPKAVPMSLSQLDNELAMHESQWGEVAGRSAVIGTVSHQHIYGLLWRVLWPLAGSRPFIAEVCHYAEDALAHAEQVSSAVLITTPTHLARWPDQPGGVVESKWTLVVSSTAPLSREHSVFAREYFGVPVTEIFGSSETGGIAWRQQTEDEVWTTLKGIDVSSQPETGALLLKSPLLDHDDWFTTGDRAEVYGPHRFRLLGRLDRIAKIEGKRVSLTNMESRLAEHGCIEEARVVVLNGRRTETAVVAVLDTVGRQWLDAEGKRAVTRNLRQWLAGHFETPVLPRRWRLVDALPRNAQGKIPQQYLAELFDRASDASTDKDLTANNRLPIVLNRDWLDANTVQLNFRMQPELVFFRGHFDELPVVPGVVEIHWVEHYAREMFGERLASRDAFTRMEAVKFQELIRPGREVCMELTLQPECSRVVFRLYYGHHTFSSGRLVFDAPQEPV